MIKNLSVSVVAGVVFTLLKVQSSSIEFAFAAVTEPATLPVTSFCAGSRYACVAFNNNKIKCWGDEEGWGRVVNGYSDTLGESSNEVGDNLPFVSVSDGSSTIIKISCGYLHTCIRFESGSLKCVGSNQYGQIGIGVTTTRIGENSGNSGIKV